MPGRGPQTFKKRQKEQERKERQQEKMAKRLQRKAERAAGNTAREEHDSSAEGLYSSDQPVGAEQHE
jgi:hypothetical protein